MPVAFTPGTPLAVTLASFAADAQADRVVVSWETVSELLGLQSAAPCAILPAVSGIGAATRAVFHLKSCR